MSDAPDTPKKPIRVTLTAKEAESLEGIELAEAIRGCLEDGWITIKEADFLEAEAKRLSDHCTFTAIPFVLKIISDFKAGDTEDKDVQYWAQEELARVVPKDMRDGLKDARLNARRNTPATAAQIAYLERMGYDGDTSGFGAAKAI